MQKRELTRHERADIKRLVLGECANWHETYRICAPADKPCLMLEITHTGALCRYFKESVLSLNSRLEAALTQKPIRVKRCIVCGKDFIPTGRQAYCSEYCAGKGQRKMTAARVRKHRENKMG